MKQRELKFRMWDIENQSMKTSKRNAIYFDGSLWPEGVDEFRSENYILMQYTGWLDTNLKGIYEGDIVDAFEEDGGTYSKSRKTITFEKASFMAGIYSMSHYAHFVVVGNIYQNKELLK